MRIHQETECVHSSQKKKKNLWFFLVASKAPNRLNTRKLTLCFCTQPVSGQVKHGTNCDRQPYCVCVYHFVVTLTLQVRPSVEASAHTVSNLYQRPDFALVLLNCSTSLYSIQVSTTVLSKSNAITHHSCTKSDVSQGGARRRASYHGWQQCFCSRASTGASGAVGGGWWLRRATLTAVS